MQRIVQGLQDLGILSGHNIICVSPSPSAIWYYRYSRSVNIRINSVLYTPMRKKQRVNVLIQVVLTFAHPTYMAFDVHAVCVGLAGWLSAGVADVQRVSFALCQSQSASTDRTATRVDPLAYQTDRPALPHTVMLSRVLTPMALSLALALCSTDAFTVTFKNGCGSNMVLFDASTTETIANGGTTSRTIAASSGAHSYRYGTGGQATRENSGD